MEERKFELRKLCTKDLFPMMKIISKIGVKEFKTCFDSVKMSADGKTDFAAVGIGVFLDLADVLLSNIGSCEKDLYKFLGSLSGLTPDEIGELEPALTVELITELVNKEEFRDFFTAVLKSLAKEK